MKRIFILSRHPLFGHGVESLLCKESELEVVGQEKDANRALECVKELMPDVVILDNDDPEVDLKPTVMRILKVGSRITVVGVSLQDNTIHIYRGEKRTIHEVEDLVEAIEG